MVEGESAQEPKILICRLDHSFGNNVQFRWSIEGDPEDQGERGVYLVSKSRLTAIAEKLRGKPKLRDGLLNEVERLEAAGPSDELDDALRQLAAKGAELTAAALGELEPANLRSASEPFARWFRETVATAPVGSWRLIMVHLGFPEHMHVVPWGLAFMIRPTEHIADLPTTHDGMSGFWAVAFNVVSVGSAWDRGSLADMALEDGKVTCAAIVEVGPTVVSKFRQDRAWTKRHDQALITNKDRAVAHAKDQGQRHIFYYLYLEPEKAPAESAEFSFDEGDLALDESTLSAAYDRLDSIAVTMIDGDCVIRGDRGAKWVAAILKDSRRGFIACETDIFSQERRAFGWTLLRHTLLAGKPLLTAFAEARRANWPRSILYGLYCNPFSIRVDPPAGLDEILEVVDVIVESLAKQSVN